MRRQLSGTVADAGSRDLGTARRRALMLALGDNGQRDHAESDRPRFGQNHSQTCSGRRSTECLGALQLAWEPPGRPTPPRASETTGAMICDIPLTSVTSLSPHHCEECFAVAVCASASFAAVFSAGLGLTASSLMRNEPTTSTCNVYRDPADAGQVRRCMITGRNGKCRTNETSRCRQVRCCGRIP